MDFWNWEPSVECRTCHVDMVSTGIDATQWHGEARRIKEKEIAEEIARKNPEYDPALEAEREEKRRCETARYMCCGSHYQ